MVGRGGCCFSLQFKACEIPGLAFFPPTGSLDFNLKLLHPTTGSLDFNLNFPTSLEVQDSKLLDPPSSLPLALAHWQSGSGTATGSVALITASATVSGSAAHCRGSLIRLIRLPLPVALALPLAVAVMSTGS